MIRKRDFVLYLLILTFVILSAVYTGLTSRATTQVNDLLLPTNQEIIVPSAITDQVEPDRQARIEYLKSQLALGKVERIAFGEGVEEVVKDPDRTPPSGPIATTSDRVVIYCGPKDSHTVVSTWPQVVTLEQTSEGRSFVTEKVITEMKGTSTATSSIKVALITIPQRTIRSTFDSCLPDTTIGVQTSGKLIDNGDAVNWHNYGYSDLIGFARDGFAIYGPIENEEELDICGGKYNDSFEYQYHLRESQSHVIGCYASVPVNFN